MSVKQLQQICGKLIVVLLMIVTYLMGVTPHVSAQVSPFESFSTVAGQTCGPSDRLTYSVTVPELRESDEFYLKTNAANLISTIDVYVQQGEDCVKFGTVTANDKSWTRLGTVTSKTTGQDALLVLSSPNLGADIYASVATVLMVPPGRCESVKMQCVGGFEGYTGAIEPVAVSAPGEFVTVQQIPDLSQEKLLYVEYYDGGDFLYVQNEITDVDQRYLRGGDRTVKKVVYLSNNRLLTITEQVAMPRDPLYSQYIKSSFFRLGGQTRLALGIVSVALVIGLLLLVIRRIHAWRTYRSGHGIDNYLRTHQKS